MVADPIRVVDDEMRDVPRDGETMGEVVMRGQQRDGRVLRRSRGHGAGVPAAAGSTPATSAVWHPDGYIELRDRAKDIIISGGENISTIEVEQAVVSHPAVLEVAVVAMPDEQWGERPKAFVVLQAPALTPARRRSSSTSAARSPASRLRTSVEFVDELPKTSTGKIQKYVLREGVGRPREADQLSWRR